MQMRLVVVGDHPAPIIELSENGRNLRLNPAVRDGQIEMFLSQRQAPGHWYLDFCPLYATDLLRIWVFTLFETSQYFAPWL